jgi:hypothetical protein
VTLIERGVSPEVDREALAVFFHLGFFLGEDTPFRHIKVVPPDVTFVWDGSLTIDSAKTLGGSASDVSRDGAIDQYASLFRAAIARRVSHREIVLPLSGGRDSRHILFALDELGCDPTYCLTARPYPPFGKNDVEVARVLASELGLKHVAVARVPRFRAEFQKNVATHFCADEHAWLVPLTPHLAHAAVVYDGIGGDVLSASLWQRPKWLELFRGERFLDLAETLMRPSMQWLATMPHPSLRIADAAEIARAAIAKELEQYKEAQNPLSMFFFWNRTRREIALSPFGLFSDVETCYCPYLDHVLFDFLAALPAELLLDRAFHTDTIARAYPRYAHLPYSEAAQWKSSRFEQTRLAMHGLAYGARHALGTTARIARASSLRLGRGLDRRKVTQPVAPDLPTTIYLLQLESLIASAPG